MSAKANGKAGLAAAAFMLASCGNIMTKPYVSPASGPAATVAFMNWPAGDPALVFVYEGAAECRDRRLVRQAGDTAVIRFPTEAGSMSYTFFWSGSSGRYTFSCNHAATIPVAQGEQIDIRLPSLRYIEPGGTAEELAKLTETGAVYVATIDGMFIKRPAAGNMTLAMKPGDHAVIASFGSATQVGETVAARFKAQPGRAYEIRAETSGSTWHPLIVDLATGAIISHSTGAERPATDCTPVVQSIRTVGGATQSRVVTQQIRQSVQAVDERGPFCR